jgi:hypothetical protein
VAGAAVLATVPFSPQPVVLAQTNTYVTPDQGQSGNEQPSQEMRKRKQGQSTEDQSTREMRKHRAEGQHGDEQASQDVKKRRIEGQANEEQTSRETRREGKVVWDRDRHGERMRHREGRFHYFHEGYWYATPWWTTGIVVGGGGISCREGARIVFRRGFNRLVPIDCGGDTYTYRAPMEYRCRRSRCRAERTRPRSCSWSSVRGGMAPLRYRLAARLETIPSSPSSTAALSSHCPLRRLEYPGLRCHILLADSTKRTKGAGEGVSLPRPSFCSRPL